MLGARALIALAVVPVILLGCAGAPVLPATPATPAATETPSQVPIANPPGHPEPRGELSRYIRVMTQLGFRCDSVEAMECLRVEGTVEYSVDISSTPDGWVDGLHIYARALDPVIDLRSESRSVAARMAAIARPLLDGPEELLDVQSFLQEHLAVPGNGDRNELGRIAISVGGQDPNEREGGTVSAHLTFTDVVTPETP